jgi:hypothetical protein
MKTIGDIKEYCIAVDLAYISDGVDIGVVEEGDYTHFKDENTVRAFYSRIKLKDLLELYSSYNGLEFLRADGEDLDKHGYTLDIQSVIDYL